MEFWKMNGAGNDFLIIDNRSGEFTHEELPGLARTLCERHLSIGADGMMVVEKSDKADLKMVFLNSDGSLGEMCGNGARCICRYAYETGLSGDTQVIETTAGIVTGVRVDKRLYRIRLNDPTTLENRPITVDGKEYACWYVELGNPGIPHAVVPIAGLKDYPENELFELGRKMRYHSVFPKGANVNFYEIIGENHVFEHTWERGVEDFTYACGTGTGSVGSVLTVTGQSDGKNIMFDMPGGRLFVDVVRKDGVITDLFLIGPTNIVAKGIVTDEEL